MPFEISIGKMRAAINKIEDERNSVMIKCAYLLAARNCELLTKTNPSEILSNSSKPYGIFLQYKFKNYEETPATTEKAAVIQKVLVVTVAVAKRGKRMKGSKEQTTPQLKEEEVIEALLKFKQPKLLDKWQSGKLKLDPKLIQILLGKIALRVVALPTSAKFEPWTYDLLMWIRRHGSLSFDITRRRFIQILRANLGAILPPIHKKNPRNLLRHWRITHLIEYYEMNPYHITSYAGWKIGSTYSAMGMAASPNIDHYAHLRWKQYFPMLLKPLAQFD